MNIRRCILGFIIAGCLLLTACGSNNTAGSNQNEQEAASVNSEDVSTSSAVLVEEKEKQSEETSDVVNEITEAEVAEDNQSEADIDGEELEYISVDYSTDFEYPQESFSTTYGSGEYLVGTDMPAGTYVGFTTGGTAECEVYSGIDEEEKLNDDGYYSNYLVIFKAEDGNLVKLFQSYCVPIEEVEEKGLENYGIFVVGDTIPEGRYKLEARDGDEGHVSVLSDLDSNTRYADYEFVNRFYVAVNEGDILIAGNVNFVMPENDESDDTAAYLVSDEWGEHYSEGCYRVGIDIDPGIYIVYSNHDNGAASLVDFYDNGYLDDSCDTEFINGAQIFNLEAGQYINFDENSTMLQFDEAYSLGSEKSHIYLVGEDIAAGDIKLVHKNEDDNDNAIVITEGDLDNNKYEDFDIFETQAYFEFVEGDYVLLFDCEPAENEIIDTVDEEPAQEVEESETEIAFNESCNLTIEDFSIETSDLTGTESYVYDGLSMDPNDISTLMGKTYVDQGIMYDSIGIKLDGICELDGLIYAAHSPRMYEIMLGEEKPETWDEIRDHAYELNTFISEHLRAVEILPAFENLTDCVIGTFDYDGGIYEFTITDTRAAAEELGISETMLGYILAYLSEYTPDITFDGYSVDFSLDQSYWAEQNN